MGKRLVRLFVLNLCLIVARREKMKDVIKEIYGPLLTGYGFLPDPEDRRYGPNGICWKLDNELGFGTFWTYGQKDLFNIKVHDFSFHQDSFMEFSMPECLSITYYESISGEELSPYRRMSAGCIKAFLGGQEPYKVLIHKNIPIRCIGIEISPAYYEIYLKEQYPDEYIHLIDAFRSIDQTDHFPDMVRLLEQVQNYRGEGIAARLFYEGKVAEAVSMVVEHSRNHPETDIRLSADDRKQMENLTAYINDHYAFDLPLERLAHIACMGTTKLKKVFRQYHGCTITEYIQQRRMSQAEHLLAGTDLNIGQVARTVGYASASRFAQLFRKSTGLLPMEYRRFIGNAKNHPKTPD